MSESEQTSTLRTALELIDDISLPQSEGNGPVNCQLIRTIQMAIQGMIFSLEKNAEKFATVMEMQEKVHALEKELYQKTAPNKQPAEEIAMFQGSSRKRSICEEALTTYTNEVTSRLRSASASSKKHGDGEQNVHNINTPLESESDFATHRPYFPPMLYLREVDVDGRKPSCVFPVSAEQWRLHDGTNRDFAIRLVGSDPICHIPVAIPGFDEKQFSIQLRSCDGINMLHVRNLSKRDSLIVSKQLRTGPWIYKGDVIYIGGESRKGPKNSSRPPEGYKAKFIVDMVAEK